MSRRRVYVVEQAHSFLEEAGRWRERCIDVLRRAPVRGDLYMAASGIMDAIDGLAEVVAGDRGHFHLKPPSTHGTPGSHKVED